MISDKRTSVIDLLESITPLDKQEEKSIQKIKKLIFLHENIFERECLEAHLTASALVINLQTKMILLHLHKKLNMWLQFGGHADGETNLPFVALKESQEETGLDDLRFYFPQEQAAPFPLDIDLQIIPKYNEIKEHYHLDFRYLLFTKAIKIPKPGADESQNLKFFSFQEIEKMENKLDPALLRLVKKAEKLID